MLEDTKVASTEVLVKLLKHSAVRDQFWEALVARIECHGLTRIEYNLIYEIAAVAGSSPPEAVTVEEKPPQRGRLIECASPEVNDKPG